MDFVSNIWSKAGGGLKKEDSAGEADQQASVESTADQVNDGSSSSDGAATATTTAAAAEPDSKDGTSCLPPVLLSSAPVLPVRASCLLRLPVDTSISLIEGRLSDQTRAEGVFFSH